MRRLFARFEVRLSAVLAVLVTAVAAITLAACWRLAAESLDGLAMKQFEEVSRR
jgi:hypothetical protein